MPRVVLAYEGAVIFLVECDPEVGTNRFLPLRLVVLLQIYLHALAGTGMKRPDTPRSAGGGGGTPAIVYCCSSRRFLSAQNIQDWA